MFNVYVKYVVRVRLCKVRWLSAIVLCEYWTLRQLYGLDREKISRIDLRIVLGGGMRCVDIVVVQGSKGTQAQR